MIDILSLLILDVAIQRVLCRIQPGKPGNQKRNEAVGKYVQQNGIKRVEAPQASIDYLKQHPELSIDFINRYGYLPSLGQ